MLIISRHTLQAKHREYLERFDILIVIATHLLQEFQAMLNASLDTLIIEVGIGDGSKERIRDEVAHFPEARAALLVLITAISRHRLHSLLHKSSHRLHDREQNVHIQTCLWQFAANASCRTPSSLCRLLALKTKHLRFIHNVSFRS